MKLHYASFVLLATICCFVNSTEYSEFLVRDYSFVYSHNAATGYLSSQGNGYVKNQEGTLAEQLDCGARVFDLRPQLDDKLIFHHGVALIQETDFKTVIAEVKSWLTNPLRQKDLVVLVVKDCKTSGSTGSCRDQVITELTESGISGSQVVTDCSVLDTLTIGSAIANGRNGNQDSGGLLVLIGSGKDDEGCIDPNYDEYVKVRCYEGDLSCLEEQDKPTIGQKMLDHLKEVSADAKNPHTSRLNSLNGHFQYDQSSIGLGLAAGSTIINDEETFGMNAQVLEWVKSREFNHINALQLDNVCNGGSALKLGLETYANVTGLQVSLPTESPTNDSEEGSGVQKVHSLYAIATSLAITLAVVL